MKLVIDIPEELYKDIKENGLCGYCSDREIVSEAIANGKPLPKKHGDLVDRDSIRHAYDCSDIEYTMVEALEDAPTIIEADNEEDKRFCDRCGNEIVETKRTAIQAFCDAVEQMKVKFGGKHRIKYIVQINDLDNPKIPRPIADLCEQCNQELTAFMNCTLKAKDGKEVKNDTK